MIKHVFKNYSGKSLQDRLEVTRIVAGKQFEAICII